MTTTVSEGQSLVDVAVQECGSLTALFDLADANGLAITDALTPGQVLALPAPTAPDVASYFATRRQRINTGDAFFPILIGTGPRRDFNLLDFLKPDFS